MVCHYETGFLELFQQITPVACQHLQSLPLAWLHSRYFQNYAREFCDPCVFRFDQLFQTHYVLF